MNESKKSNDECPFCGKKLYDRRILLKFWVLVYIDVILLFIYPILVRPIYMSYWFGFGLEIIYYASLILFIVFLLLWYSRKTKSFIARQM